MEIKSGMFVAVSYKLHALLDGETPEFIEETKDGSPLQFIFNTGAMLESFENNLAGLKVGDKYDFVIKAADAYGEESADMVVELPKEIFMVDGKIDEEVIVEGAVLPMRDAQGNTLQGTVESINENTITMDFNHPMAGADLHFVGEVLEVREPREEDVKSCGGGCGSGCGDCGCGDEPKGGCGCGC